MASTFEGTSPVTRVATLKSGNKVVLTFDKDGIRAVKFNDKAKTKKVLVVPWEQALFSPDFTEGDLFTKIKDEVETLADDDMPDLSEDGLGSN